MYLYTRDTEEIKSPEHQQRTLQRCELNTEAKSEANTKGGKKWLLRKFLSTARLQKVIRLHAVI